MSSPATVSAATRSVDRALSLLAHVCEHDHTTLTESARAVGLSPTTALRLLRTLERQTFVRRDADGYFHPGARVIRVGVAALGRDALLESAVPAMRRLVGASGESAYVSVIGGVEDALCIGMVEGTHSIRHAGWVGRSVPLSGSADGRALTGEMPATGYVVVRSTVEPDVTAIAAPLRWAGGVAGALSVVGPSYRLTATTSRALGVLVASEAQSIGSQLQPTATVNGVKAR